MTTIKNHRLSSDFLYTYTPKLDTIKLILKNGLRHSLNKEKLPYNNFEQHNFIVSFCDILPEQADYHKSVYGNYSLAFKKDWGIRNKVSPLRYINDNSPGATMNYSQLKNDIREARKTLQDGNQLDYFLSLILHISAREKGLLTKDSIFNEIGNTALDNYIGEIDLSFNDKRTKFGDANLREIFNDWIVPLLHGIEKSVDELENRDAYMRIYNGDFRTINNKIFYDEREWRSVKFVTEVENNTNPSLLIDAMKNEFLPETYNLKFDSKDIVAILVETDTEKQEIKKYILDELNHLSGLENSVFTFQEHIA